MDRNTINQKHHVKLDIADATGVIGSSDGYKIYGEVQLRVVTKTVGGSSIITVQGRLEGDTSWTAIDTITGATTATFDISDWDYVRYYNSTNDGVGELYASGFFKAGATAVGASFNSFETIQTDLGTNPQADSNSDTLTLTSSDDSLLVTGNSTTDTIDLKVSPPATEAISALNIDWSVLKTSGGLYTKTLGANSTFTFSNATAGQCIVIRLTNTASNYTVTFPTIKWTGGAAPTMTVGAKSDIYTVLYDGTDYFGSYVQDLY